MKLLALLRWPWGRVPQSLTPDASDRRANERFRLYQPVSVGPPRTPPVAGTVVDLSIGGAAIRIEGTRPAWLTGLNQDTEISLGGLLAVPISCQTVAWDRGVLRVRFTLDDTLRHELREVWGMAPQKVSPDDVTRGAG
jgi:hypothetical protein